MNWIDQKNYIEILPPKEFNFQECLIFLGRSNQEVLHKIKDGSLYKLVKVEEALIFCKVSYKSNSIRVEFPISKPSSYQREKVGEYIWEWFDLEQDLQDFYQMASEDKVLNLIVHKYYGLRIMCIPDLFEALVWAIIGQQINLTFAYNLKERFVEAFGEAIIFQGEKFWVFPSFEAIAALSVEDLKNLQFTTRKAEYIIGIAKDMKSGILTKEMLKEKQDYHEVKKVLMNIRGSGPWTADYVMMKSLHETSSFPIADVGLHNALKILLGLKEKPTIEEIKEYAANWEGWQGYATFYLWRSLYDK